jgi:hypothetical protein
MKRNPDGDSGPVSIAEHETLGGFCRRNGIEYGSDTYKNSRVVLSFREKIRKLQAIGRSHGIIPEEMLLMISLNFGWKWDDIPFRKFEELEQFPQSMNREERFAVLWPEWHAYYRRTTEDQRWADYQKAKPLLQGLVGNMALAEAIAVPAEPMGDDDRGELPLPA